MIKRLFRSVGARIVVAVIALSLMLVAVPAALSQDGVEVDYAENSTEIVANFTAADQDSLSDDEWIVSGVDGDSFEISSNGELRFVNSPDFENPTDADSDRVYEVTVGRAGGEIDVKVNITNVDEMGVVELDTLQPQVTKSVIATVTDPDSDSATEQDWQWARSTDKVDWIDIEDADALSYNPVKADVDHYLKATVTYNDGVGTEDDVASMVTSYIVENRPAANAAPSFVHLDDNDDVADGVQVTRSVDENTAKLSGIGSPIAALDADGDPLLYTLGGNDAKHFEIDRRNGQLIVKTVFDVEHVANSDVSYVGDENDTNEYTVKVTATDPSGSNMYAMVDITVNDVNEAPTFTTASTELTVNEGSTADGVWVSAPEYEATDEDVEDGDVDYSIVGVDSAYFDIGDEGALMFDDHTPNFEIQDEYSITVMAFSGVGTRKLGESVDVEITVVNQADAGRVMLSQREPQVGKVVVATLRDDDGSIQIDSWQWYNGTAVESVEGIEDATSASYIPVASDIGNKLSVVIKYDDGHGDRQTAVGVSDANVQEASPNNTAPVFVDDEETVMRMVGERVPANTPVGDAVSATDADNNELLIYTLSGVDADSFSIDRASGQIRAMDELDYEVRDMYAVIVTATDPSGASVSTDVTIKVEDVDDPAIIAIETAMVDVPEEMETECVPVEIRVEVPCDCPAIVEVPEIVEEIELVNNAPVFNSNSVLIIVDENTMGIIGDPVVATDADGDELTYNLSDTSVLGVYANGQLMVSADADLNYEREMLYNAVLTASDGMDSDTIDVYVSVTNVGLLNVGDTNDNGTMDRDEVLEILQLFFEASNR